MSDFGVKAIQNIAHLARLNMDEAQQNQYSRDMANILKLVENMESINTEHIEPMAHPLQLNQRLREDEVTETNQRELFQSIAPAVEEGLYLVPQVIEE